MTEQQQREPIPAWARFFLAFADKTIFAAPGTPRYKVAWAVNIHKVVTFFLIVAMMFAYDNFSTAAYIYLGLHGVYGYCWLVKDLGFRDHQLDQKVSSLGFANLYLLLIGWYWLLPWLFLSRHLEPSGLMLFVAIALHTLGVVIMISADGQRHWVLKHRTSPGLITDGLYRYTRNPNYLGELMLYGAYALLAAHWLGWLIYAYMALYFLARMKGKDHSISRHPGWQAYKRETGLLIPWAVLTGRALFSARDKGVKAGSAL